jgi:hypothetical protein
VPAPGPKLLFIGQKIEIPLDKSEVFETKLEIWFNSLTVYSGSGHLTL